MSRSDTAPAQPQIPGHGPSIQNTIQSFAADLDEIHAFFNIPFSPTCSQKVKSYLTLVLKTFSTEFDFDHMRRDEQVDYLMLQSHLNRLMQQTETEFQKYYDARAKGLLSDWTDACIKFVETRRVVGKQTGQQISTLFQSAEQGIESLITKMKYEGANESRQMRSVMLWTFGQVNQLIEALKEAVEFYQGYDPVISWWIEKPWASLESKVSTLAELLKNNAESNGPTSTNDIVGQPIGREALLIELKAEWIAYTPEELLCLGEKEFAWCERELKSASEALGFEHPQDALEHVRNTFVEPGEQIHVVRDLGDEAISYVEKHDLITVPPVAKEYWQMTMMPPARQKINPFFTGGERVEVSYPTGEMCHEEKLMSMRGNNPPFSRSTVHHELIPGHHLQFYYMDRYRPYRKVFETPFWIEGWALYWEFLLWQRGFPSEVGQKWATNEAENRIGMLFWRMHRCARIIFSIKFHLGEMTPQECIDLLVNRVGHERATAEGEVRRSFAGDYPPLYQAGYMLGAFQLWELRRELVEDQFGPQWDEKSFHDAILRENNLPIELLRASLNGEKLTRDRKPLWKFYEHV